MGIGITGILPVGIVTKGIIIGILVSAPMGPIGMLCVQRTLNKGRWSGFVSGLGATLSDMLYALFTCLFMGLVVSFVESYQRSLEILGSVVLCFFGYYIYRSDPVRRLRNTEGEVKLSSIAQDFVTAFLLTFSNVLIVFLYLGLFARFSFISSLRSIWETFLGIIGIVIGASLWWFLLTTAISLLRRWFTLRSLRLLNRIVGGIIILLSLIGLFLSLSPLLLSLLQDKPQ